MRTVASLGAWGMVFWGVGCGGQAGEAALDPGLGSTTPPPAACTAQGGSGEVAEPLEVMSFQGGLSESWLGSPVVVDLDGDGRPAIVVGRSDELVVFDADGSERFRVELEGRCWSSAVVADLIGSPGLEVAIACRERVYAFQADGQALSGFPVVWEDELRSLAAADIDGDGQLELVAGSTSDVEANGQTDILIALNPDGSIVPGFPPNAAGSGCADTCYVHAGFDQNLALGDVDGDGLPDIFLPQDNAYFSLHHGTGEAFDAAPLFEVNKVHGVRGLHDYELAQQGWAPDEESALQAHFTNTAPVIADLDDDGVAELVALASVQNAAQSNREQGVALWVLHHDGSRPAAWQEPLHFSGFLSGLGDYGDNIVALTNQVSVADIDPTRAGPEVVFAGFDGLIHAVDAARNELWSYRFTSAADVATGGVLIADLSRDGSPEVVFATYSTTREVSRLIILDAGGNELHALSLPERGAMAVPALGDLDGDGDLEIVLSLKDSDPALLVFEVPDSGNACVLWPTGRGNALRNGWVVP